MSGSSLRYQDRPRATNSQISRMTLLCDKLFRNYPLASQGCRQLSPTESASVQHKQASSMEELQNMLSSSTLDLGVPDEYRSPARWSIVSCLTRSWQGALEG